MKEIFPRNKKNQTVLASTIIGAYTSNNLIYFNKNFFSWDRIKQNLGIDPDNVNKYPSYRIDPDHLKKKLKTIFPELSDCPELSEHGTNPPPQMQMT